MSQPTLIDWSTVNAAVEAAHQDFDYDTRSQALAHVVLAAMFPSTVVDPADEITDGGADRGVDAVVVQEEAAADSVHFFSVKCVDSYERSRRNFPSGEIDKLLSFFSDLMRKNISRDSVNPLLWGKVQEIWSLLESKAPPAFVVHLVSNQSALVADEARRFATGLGAYHRFELQEHSLSSVASLLVETKRPKVSGKIQLVDNQYFERVDGNVRGLVGTIEAAELVRLISLEDSGKINPAVFDENVRVYLTGRNRFNKRIIESALSETNSEFWYLNNGITITCDSMDYQPGLRAAPLHMENFQIVNGGQTSNALFEAWQGNRDQVRKVVLLARVYETKNPEMSLHIAETTNSQTPIKSRDLRSNDEIQRKLEEAFLAKGLYYERKAGQHKGRPRSNRVDALFAAQAFVAYYQGEPLISAKDRGKIFGELYDEIFNDELTAEMLLTAIAAFRPIQTRKKALQHAIRRSESFDREDLLLIDGSYHLLYALGRMALRNRVSLEDIEEVVQLLPDAREVCVTAVREEAKDPAFALKRFFKSTRATRFIDEAILSAG